MTSHLHEERLFDCYLTARAGAPLDPPEAVHLTDCAECASRYAELAAFMEEIRDIGDAEVDEIFTAERLQQQRDAITRRLQTVGRSARVIHFPHAAAATRQLPPPARRPFPRWVAATAAAGLVGGMAAGMFLERAGHRAEPTTEAAVVTLPGAAAPAESAAATPASPVDSTAFLERQERFMSELELAADRPRTAELAAYDEFTPHTREVRYTLAGR